MLTKDRTRGGSPVERRIVFAGDHGCDDTGVSARKPVPDRGAIAERAVTCLLP